MRISSKMVELMDQLKVHVLLYSGEKIDHHADEDGCRRLVTAAEKIRNAKIDTLLVRIEQEGMACGMHPTDAELFAPARARSQLAS